MSAASSTLPAFTFGEYVPTADARVVMFGVSWEGYEAQLTLRGDVAGPRIAYLDGAMELMSPSKGHERVKSYIGMLIETFAEERVLTTVENRRKRSVEARTEKWRAIVLFT